MLPRSYRKHIAAIWHTVKGRTPEIQPRVLDIIDTGKRISIGFTNATRNTFNREKMHGCY